MTLQALWPVVQQYQNKNGSILCGGKIYIYYQGRTALATTYHDEEGTVVNANPVLLDNNGRATVFANTIYSYTIVVCDYYGKELFSQDITLHDAISTAKDVIVIGSNGSVKSDTTTLPNGVQYDLSVNTDIIATKESVDKVKTDLNTLTGKVDTHTTQIESIESSLANKKDKQNELNFNGSATKTIKSITQNVNGELNVEFADIALPQEVPNVEIKSKDGSVNVTESTDSQTNIKTFDLSVNVDDKIPDPSTSNPLMDGAASVGSSIKYAREDHVHPSDTSKEAVLNKTTVVMGTSNTKYPTDKAVAEFVNSSIATNTANYISNNGEPFTSVEELEAYTGTVTNNDYAFVTGTDSEGNTYYDRYKATVSGSTVTWALEYRLNNSSFTAAQWAAINSGVTSEKANYWDGKQDALTFDGSTTTQALTKAGTWETFNNYSHPAGSAPSKTGVPTANATPGFGGTFKVNQIKTDSTSHVSAVTERTITIPNATATTSADGLMSAADKTKLNGIATGAEVNIQSDWNVTDSTSDAFIKNKPYFNRYVSSTGVIFKICTVPKYVVTSTQACGIEVVYRIGDGAVNGELLIKATYELYLKRIGNISSNYNTVKFYYIDNPSSSSRVDIYADSDPYCTLTVAPLLNMPKDRVDFTGFGTVISNLPEGATEITPLWVANSASSSGTAPVKVDAYGVLTPVPMDKIPTASSTNLMTSGAIKTALDSRIPAPTSTTGTQVLKCINGVIQWVNE